MCIICNSYGDGTVFQSIGLFLIRDVSLLELGFVLPRVVEVIVL